MLELLYVCLGIFVFLCVSEVLWRKKVITGELSRKFVHISVGIFIAFWPYFLSWAQIHLLVVALLIGIILSYNLHIFHAIHEVKRRTWGELLYPVGIGIVAFADPKPWIFMAAILHLCLADGLAAIIGKKWGKTNGYKVFGYVKSLAGTATFFVVSLLILLVLFHVNGIVNHSLLLLVLPAVTAVLENIGVRGFDNILVPVAVLIGLSGL